MGYMRWIVERMFVLAPAGAYVGAVAAELPRIPAAQKPGSFSLDRVMEAVSKPQGGKGD